MSFFEDLLKKWKKQPTERTLSTGVSVPTNEGEADILLGTMAELARNADSIEIKMDEEIAAIRQKYEDSAAPLAQRYNELENAVIIYAEYNRPLLTKNNAVKTAAFSNGEIVWRNLPAKVTITNNDKVIESIRQLLNLDQDYIKFLRTNVTPNKEAMLEDRERAQHIPGVSIGSDGEQLKVVPKREDLIATTQTQPKPRKSK